jgi:hypothetical protein
MPLPVGTGSASDTAWRGSSWTKWWSASKYRAASTAADCPVRRASESARRNDQAPDERLRLRDIPGANVASHR